MTPPRTAARARPGAITPPRTAGARARPGAIIAVRIQGVWHEGLIAGEREAPRTVIHKSKRTGLAVEEPIGDFAAGGTVRIVGYPGKLPADEVLRRARARIGEPWTILENCQRFTRSCHGVPSRSPDLERTVLGFAIGALGSSLVGRVF